ncbi:hypothetical protein O997_04335 [Anaplasma phagocytophilum str. MRK]|nr:hypothetical protein O997_04335 [Anaplasma phagocytophilum str. MRK]
MEISSPAIDGKVCKTKSVATGGSGAETSSFGTYASITNAEKTTGRKNDTSLCGGHGSTKSAQDNGSPRVETLKDFARKTLAGGGNWPKSSATTDAVQQPKPNDNAEAVATDLVNLNRDEKTIVAGLLAKTIEGGEVVEIRAVSSTFVSI